MKLLFLDTTNNICHVCHEAVSLQENFDQFLVKVRKQGLMDPCMGTIYFANISSMRSCEVGAGEGIVKMTHPEPYKPEHYWALKLVAGLIWPAGHTYTPPTDHHPQYPRATQIVRPESPQA